MEISNRTTRVELPQRVRCMPEPHSARRHADAIAPRLLSLAKALERVL